jgi:hypothetical protein
MLTGSVCGGFVSQFHRLGYASPSNPSNLSRQILPERMDAGKARVDNISHILDFANHDQYRRAVVMRGNAHRHEYLQVLNSPRDRWQQYRLGSHKRPFQAL